MTIKKLAKGCFSLLFCLFSFFLSRTDKKPSANWLCGEKNNSVGGVVYIDPFKPPCLLFGQAVIFSMIPKMIGRNCLLIFFDAPLPNELKLTNHFIFFHGLSSTKTIALKICLCKRESSCYPKCWYIYIG